MSRLGERLGLSPLETAWGIHRVANENMAAAARIHAIEKNRDPRRYSLLAFGGAGPAHAVAVASLLDIGEVIFPPGAGVAVRPGLPCRPARRSTWRGRTPAASTASIGRASRRSTRGWSAKRYDGPRGGECAEPTTVADRAVGRLAAGRAVPRA